MNTPNAPTTDTRYGTASRTGSGLLDVIRAMRASVGEGLNDAEFTHFLRERNLPMEQGFRFLSYSDGMVTLTVPEQNPADWYPSAGWLRTEKEDLAREVARKHGLSLCEPPDEVQCTRFPRPEMPGEHHHLELNNHIETLVVAHPLYLKIRLLGVAPQGRFMARVKTPILFDPEILKDLSGLYRRGHREDEHGHLP